MEDQNTPRARRFRKHAAVVLLLVSVLWTVGWLLSSGPLPDEEPARLAPIRHSFRNPNQDVSEPVLRVLSYNIHGQAHLFDARYLERIARVIRELQPDVVGLQEVHRGGWKARYEDQAAVISRLTGMEVAYGPSFEGRSASFGNAVLTAGDIEHVEVLPLPAPGEPRTLLRSRIHVGPFDLDFYVTHLAAWGRFGRSARGLQTNMVLERLQQSRGPFVLAGDLNAAPAAPELRPLLAAQLFRMCGDAAVCTHRIMRERIDYVFADPGWTTLSSRAVEIGPSDHWPVLVELERDGEPSKQDLKPELPAGR
jgi:endonuclease/exonuclease/phosphatase family metal-dependent hydrolase